MLNKQQSTQWNSWKYAVVLPALIAFVIMFQVKVVAQEKQPATGITAIEETKFTVEVNKDATDADLAEESKVFKAEFDADVNFENIKRNTNEEITAIKVTVKDKGQSQVYEVSGNDPIMPFTIEVEKDRTGRNTIAFGTGGGDHFVKARAFYIAGDDSDAFPGDSLRTQKNRILRSYGNNGFPAPPAPSAEGHWSVNTMRIGDTDMLIVINGTKQEKGSDAIKLPLGQEIVEINVLEGKKAKKKYGKEAKEGAVEITTGANAVAFAMGPEVFNFSMIPELQDIEGMNFDITIEDFDPVKLSEMFGEGDINAWGGMSPEDMQQIQEELRNAQIEIQGLAPMFEGNGFNVRQMSEDELKETRKALEKAKKEVEESRKELEKSRKDLEKARKKLNKRA